MTLLQTIRSVRFSDDTALFDYFATIACVFFVTFITSIPLTIVTIVLFVLSIVFHYMFNVRTPTSMYLKI